MSGLIRYAGYDPHEFGRFKLPASSLGPRDQRRALRLFQEGHDTPEIAWRLFCTPAAAANALARARDGHKT